MSRGAEATLSCNGVDGDDVDGTTRREARRRDGPLNPKSKTNNDTEHGLVLEVHARGARFHHQLRELHDGREAPVAGIAVGHNGSQVVDVLPTRKRPAVVVF